jgi:imidazolonepropionase-like amidohydrolase
MNRSRIGLAPAILLVIPLAIPLAIPMSAAGSIVIQNATILTITKGTFKGSVLMRDGKIVEVGEKVRVPADAKVIEATGQYLMPGIIDCHSHAAADSINESSVWVSSMVAIEDVLNPEDIAIYRAVAGGVTTANILHGSANSIGGKCSVIKMRWGKSAGEMIFKGAKPGIKFALGENPKRRGNIAAPNGCGGCDPRGLHRSPTVSEPVESLCCPGGEG